MDEWEGRGIISEQAGSHDQLRSIFYGKFSLRKTSARQAFPSSSSLPFRYSDLIPTFVHSLPLFLGNGLELSSGEVRPWLNEDEVQPNLFVNIVLGSSNFFPYQVITI
jgi:hypothetical protein